MHNISIFGTSSDAGKSTLSFVIAKILQEAGYSVAPFKAQNVSNNASIADDGSEISIAQYFQILALNVASSWHNNPILLKSGRGSSASLIIKGKATISQDVRAYYRDLDSLKPIVKEAFNWLAERYDIVVAEGAGSPVELNLMDKDLSNIYVADEFNNKIILVADIEKGGVFASIYGVYYLLPEKLRKNIIGVIVNKFRGDISLFDKGVEIIENDFGIPVLGVLPYIPFNLGFEDSQSLINYQQNKKNPRQRIAVIAYPTMSNYNDFEPLIANDDIFVDFVKANKNLDDYTEIILPGSKLVMKDLAWLKESGLFRQIQETKTPVTGICGGFQMMFSNIIDEHNIESENIKKMPGLGFIDDDIIFQKKKIQKRGKYNIFGKDIEGFEMRYGVSKKYPLEYSCGNIRGSFVHGIFEDQAFINYRQNSINKFTNELKKHLNLDRLLNSVL